MFTLYRRAIQTPRIKLSDRDSAIVSQLSQLGRTTLLKNSVFLLITTPCFDISKELASEEPKIIYTTLFIIDGQTTLNFRIPWT